jgi:hypothetical protein
VAAPSSPDTANGPQRKVKDIPIQEFESFYHFALTVNMELQAFVKTAKNLINIASARSSIEPLNPRR